ncbi:MAG: NlpC/P60 family protein [Parvularculaceae bacterium]
MADGDAAGFDRRVTPVREDLAAIALEGQIVAPRYASGTDFQVINAAAALRRTPQRDGALETELLFGEAITLYDRQDGWGWGQARFDQYVGYIELTALASPVNPPTHRVSVLRTYRYSAPDLKSPPLDLISLNAQINLTGELEKRFVRETRGGWIVAEHLAPFASFEDDPVAVAERLIGTPYLWGGRQSLGLDCSALVQNAFEACGVELPRDTDQQQAWCAQHAEMVYSSTGDPGDLADVNLQRGDLVYWRGHTALMIDAETMVHANGTHMEVSRDLLRGFAGAVATEAGPVIAIYRPQF